MAQNQSIRIKTARVQENLNALANLQTLSGYNPLNPAFSLQNGLNLRDALLQRQTSEAQAEAALKTARDETVASEWALHNFIMGARDQVIAQYGSDSNELQSLGRKKKSEYKRRSARSSKKQ